MKAPRKAQAWEEILLSYQERFRAPYYWYPYPALISVLLVFILSGHILPGLNPRLGSIANIIELKAKKEKEGSIWIGLFPYKDRVIIKTSDNKTFSFSQNIASKEEIKDFIVYLKDRVRKESVATGLSLKSSLTKTSAVLAIDRNLNYHHIRPLLTALAEAKIAKYGFETQTTRF